MTYSDELNKLSRTPVSLVEMTLDYCGRTFGVSPCLATGEPCYNTFPTCKYKTAYLKQSKTYKFTSADAPLPFKSGERPYIKGIQYLPTEITDNLTVKSRTKVSFYDEPDTDVGIDPYVSQRSSIQGTFWKKLLARNPNYKGRDIKIYEGFLGNAEAEFQQKFIGRIGSASFDKGQVTVEVKDLLLSLDDVMVPPKLDIKLLVDIDAAETTIALTSVTGLDSPDGYVRIGDEIIYYTGVSGTANQLTGCTRGYFATTAAAHGAKDKVQKVRYYAPANPFNILKEMLLTDAGYAAGDVNSTDIDYWRDWPGGEVDFSAIVSEPTKLSQLYFEIVDLLDCKSWVAEDLKITIRRNIPNEPGRAYGSLTDEASISADPVGVDLNEGSRITRAYLYWDKTTIGKLEEPGSYSRLDVAVDTDAESVNEHNDQVPRTFYCRWLRSGYMQSELLDRFVKNLTMRQVWRQRDAMPILNLNVEIKDSGIITGSYVKISADDVLEKDGKPLDKAVFQIVRREVKGNKIALQALRITPRKFSFVAPDTAPDWAAATDADKEYDYITDEDGLMPDGTQGYHIWGN